MSTENTQAFAYVRTACVSQAFAYLRVSGRGQVDGDGFPRQEQAVRTYAAGAGIEVREIFREEGISGTTDMSDRPALAALMVALEENGVKTVLIEKLDRLARDLMVQETILADFRKRGFTLISAYEPDLCQDDPTRVLMRQIMGAIAQYEKTMIVAKLRAARERAKAKGGRCEGNRPYGETEEERVAVARVRELAADGLTRRMIAACLNTEGVATRSGGKWHATQVQRILSSL